MACVLLILISVLGLIIHSEGKTEEINNMHFVEATALPAKIMLTCNTSKEPSALVYWVKNMKLEGNGKSLEKNIRGYPDAGKYVCRSNTTGAILSYSTVYIKKKNDNGEVAESILSPFKEESNRPYFKCTANNYSGDFKCFWKPLEQNSNLNFTIKVTSGNAVCDVPVGPEAGMYTASCRKGIPCPSTEEYEEIGIALEVFHGFEYEEHTHNFFIKDILKPDAVECQMENSLLTWTPPKTWSTPASYYRLTYQIKMVQHPRRDWICEVDNAMQLQDGNSLSCHNRLFHRGTIYIRSRDHYSRNSAWSNWSEPCRKQSGKQDIHEDGIKNRQCECKKN
ncbi:interleukin-12 subunit beta-like [Podarcis raffonei]|uniref:interleukin-12 subunit beta-like n=1 Tax=Podarcis raffonei TaxID=65483 RepID=UPI00232930B3|nr:interleukin-12 subunit beta-like [Podarcis raffonei]